METVRSTHTDSRKSGITTLNKSIRDSDGTLLFTKFMIPNPSPDCVGRMQLISRLEEIMNKKLAIISAPAGYGKTTLLGMWLSQKGTSIRTAWVSLDEKDNDLQKFWKYILIAVEKSVSGSVENYASADCSIMEYSMDIFMNVMINRLSNMNDTIVLVLDDYHVVYEDRIHDSLQYLIKHLPCNIHVVITSRSVPPIKLAKLRSYGDLLELKTKDLRLTNSEVSEFLTWTMKLRLKESEVSKLVQFTEGWIAALNLTALSIKSSSNMKEYLGNLSHMNEYVVEYMSEEVFNLLEADIKDFLVKTSILDTLNGSLCDEVAGISNSKEIICCLEKNNVFINVLDDEKLNYRYHSLFAEFLRNRLMKISTDKVEELYLNASRWYEKSNMIQETLEYSIRSNNHRNTARLIEKFGEIMIINRDLVRLADIIEALPEHLILENSKICALYTMAVAGRNSFGNNGIFIGDIRVSFESNTFFRSEEDLLLIRIAISYANKNFRTELDYRNQMHELLSYKSSFQCLLYKIFTQIYCATGNAEKAEACLDKYISAIKEKNYYDELFIDIIYTHTLVQILCGAGKYKDALDIVSEFEKKLDTDNVPLPAANSIYLDLGYLHYEYGELELSYESIKKCIEISSIKMDFCRLISGYVLAARIKQNIGDCDDMMKYIKKAEDLCSKYNARFIFKNLVAYIVRMLLSTGEVEYAEHFLQKYEISVQDCYDVLHEEAHLALADLYIVKGEFYKAKEILEKQYKEVIKTERNLSYIRIMILKALLSKCKGNGADAVKYMKDAIERASEQRYISTFADFGTPVAEIICKVLNQKEESGLVNKKYINYALSILSHIKEPRNQMPNADLELMKCLSKREFEVLEHIINGLTNKEIASKLYIAECTVKKHINNIYAKIGAVNRDQAIQLCEKFNQ